jgi:Ser/Thr protein kinase RdoA (MazF antagonist)
MGEPRGPAGGGRGLRRPRRGHELLAAPGGRDALLARTPRLARHLEPADVAEAVRRGTERIRGWEPTAAERRLATMAEELAGLVAQAEAGLVARPPRQLVHGDVWDNNVLFRHARPVLLCDFDFMGERARVDDLALTLWCARCDLGAEGGPAQERTRLGRLVAAYDAGLDLPWRPPSVPRCRWRWSASPCCRSVAGWRAWTIRRRRAATPPASHPSWPRHGSS